MLKDRTMLKILWSAFWILVLIWWNAHGQVMNQPTRASILNSDWDINGDWTFTDVCINVKERGAAGNDSTDDTTALQAVFTELADDPDGKPHCVLFPEGIYKITSALVLPTVQHKIIKGVGRSGSVIKQYTSDTPIIKTTDNNTHTIAIRDLSLEYSAAQGAGDTDAYGLQFTATGTGGGFYYWSVDNVGIKNAYIGLGIDSADTGQIPVWGSTFTNMKFEVIKHNLARFVSPTSVGMPNLYLAGWEVVNSGVTTDGFAIQAAAANVTINGMEISQWDDEAFSFVGGRPTVINGLHMDAHQFLTNGEKIFSFGDNGPVFISGVTIATTINLPAGNGNIFHMVNSAAHATITGVQVNATLTDGTVTLASGDADADLTILDAALTNVTGGERFEHSDIISSQTETDDGAAKHIYDDTIVIGDTAHSSDYNNGWVKLYLREVIDGTAVAAALSDDQAIQMLAGAMTVTGTNAVGQDMQWINIVAQGQPATGETQQTLRAALMDTQVFGDGASNITENVLVRMLSAAGKTGTYGTARGFRVANAFSGTKPDSIEAIRVDDLTNTAVNSQTGLLIGDVSGATTNWGMNIQDDLIKWGRGVDEDLYIHLQVENFPASGFIRWGWSEALDSIWNEVDVEVGQADDGLVFRNGAQNTRTRLRLADAGHLETEDVGGAGFAEIYYPDIAPQDLTGVNCSVGQTGLDTGGNPEFCYCQPANTWNCVQLTAGGPAD